MAVERTSSESPGERLSRLRSERQHAMTLLDRLYFRKHADDKAKDDPGLQADFAHLHIKVSDLDRSIRDAENAYLEHAHLQGGNLAGPDSLVSAPPIQDFMDTQAERQRARGEALAFVGRAVIHLGKQAQGRDFDAWQAINLARALEAVEEGRFQEAMTHTENAILPVNLQADEIYRVRTPKTPTRWEIASRLVLLATRVKS